MKPSARISLAHLAVLFMFGWLGACGGGGGGSGDGGVTTGGGPAGLQVTALYSSAANWNDYLRNDGGGLVQASNTACTGDETGDHNTCLHGGEIRAVTVSGRSQCTGLSASDALGAFDWVCDSSTRPVRFVSTNLKREKNLSDLIDFTTSAWRTNSVTVRDGATTVLTTTPSVWWSNPVTIANSGGSLVDAGTIYIVTANPNDVYTIGSDRVAFLVQPGVAITAPEMRRSVVTASDKRFLWLEGEVRTLGTNTTGVELASVRFSRLRGVTILGNNNDVATSIRAGLLFTGGLAASRLLRVSIARSAGDGAWLVTDGGNLVEELTVADNIGHGLYIAGGHNVLSNIRAFGNRRSGIAYSGPQTLQQIYASANYQPGIITFSGRNSRVSNATLVNNIGDGLTLGNSGPSDSDASVVVGLASLNNRGSGFRLYHSSGVLSPAPGHGTFVNLAIGRSINTGIALINSSNNRFSGLLKVGGNATDCTVSGTNPGLVTATCANQGASDAALTTGVTIAASIKGKVTSDDVANTSDASGFAHYDLITDWLGFSNEARSWGVDGMPFPGLDHFGPCTTGDYCRIWDMSLATSDTVLRNVLPRNLNGNAASTLTHIWSVAAPTSQADCTAAMPGSVFAAGQCRSTFLRNAMEILGDGVGNDNGLCESGERCLYTPNIGAYQGHGALTSAGSFMDGDTLSGIALFEYAVNGR